MGQRESIFAASDLQRQEMNIPEWGCKITVRGLTAHERDEVEDSQAVRQALGGEKPTAFAGFRALVCSRGIINPETGARVFSNDDALALGEKSAAVLERIVDVVILLSGMGIGAVARAEGNSEDDLPDSPSSDSPTETDAPSESSSTEEAGPSHPSS